MSSLKLVVWIITCESVVIMVLSVQFLCGGDDPCHRIDNEALFCDSSVRHMAIRACSKVHNI